MKTILVTGATGFLGRHLVEQLKSAEPEARLRLLSRGPALDSGEPSIEHIQGDITKRADVMRAVESASEIYHLAGLVSRDPKKQWALYRTHVMGTQYICEAALKFQVEKLLVVSSSGTIAVGPRPVEHNESSGYKHEVVGEWPYYLSKIFAEKLAFDFAARCGLPLVVVNPSLLLGPGDRRLSSTRDIALFLEGQILALPRGGLNFVDVRDAASCLIAAMQRGRPGERYLIGGPNWTFRELIGTVARISGRRTPRLQPSLSLSLASARLLRLLFPLFGKAFRLDDVSIKMSSLFWYCDTSKARSELDFTTRDPVKTLRDTVVDLRQSG